MGDGTDQADAEIGRLPLQREGGATHLVHQLVVRFAAVARGIQGDIEGTQDLQGIVQELLAQKLRRSPSIQEIAKKMKKPVGKVKRLKEIVSKVSSLHAPIGEDGSGEFMDLIEDENLSSSVDELASFLLRERIASLLEKMTARERKILILRYGLKDGISRTLDETAKKFGITRERIRQIESVAMRKLRIYIKQQEKDLAREIRRESASKELQ